MDDKVTELKALVEQDKQDRAKKFADALSKLQEEHRVDLVPIIQIVNNQINTVLQAVARD